ncbi:hypothetical protein [Amycolatopsis sp. NPDC051903]|uniref:hypothetical protein n=1 Tax=Amycolatopsis sp. NPDC051903 TaxID=3363936 RepID=UPI0037B04C7E
MQPPEPGPWDAQLVELAHRTRAALLDLRDTDPAADAAAASALADAGFPREHAGWVVEALLHYVLGHTIDERAGALEPAAQARFAFGLELFVDGVRVRLR